MSAGFCVSLEKGYNREVFKVLFSLFFNMLASQVYQAVEAIGEGRSFVLDRGLYEFFQRGTLVEILSAEDYVLRTSQISRLPMVQQNIVQLGDQLARVRAEYDEADTKLGSWLHRQFTHRDKLFDEEGQKMKLRKAIDSTGARISGLEQEKERLHEVEESVKGYVDGNIGYARMIANDQNERRLEQLKARRDRLGQMTFSDFEQEAEAVGAAIDSYYKRFKSFYDHLVKEDGFDEESEVADFALALSAIDGDVETVSERADVINSYLYKKGHEGYDRLKAVALIAQQKGEIGQLRKDALGVFSRMIEAEHDDSCETWQDAANIIKIRGKNADEKYSRAEKVMEDLEEFNWQRDDESYLIAEVLAQKEGDASQVAREFDNLEEKLTEDHCVASGLAALILMNSAKPTEDKVTRFKQVLSEMPDSGWNDSTTYYPVAAALSLMPGCVQENVMWLDEITERLDEDDLGSNVTSRALHILQGGLRELSRNPRPEVRALYENIDVRDLSTDPALIMETQDDVSKDS